jgi:hypothetical protein
MKSQLSNQLSLQRRLSDLREELSKTEISLYPDNPYLHIKEWIAKATPIICIGWPNISDDFKSQVAISDWTNLGFAAYGGSLPGSYEHQQAWDKDAKEAQEFRQKVLSFLDGLLIVPSNDAKEVQRKRFQFLKKLYDLTKADESVEINPSVIGAELGLSDAEANTICDFLNSEGLIAFVNILDFIGITHRGIVEVEEAFSKPNEPTPHFAPINYFIQVEQMVGSQIQQGTNQSSQVLTYGNNDIEGVRKFIADLKSQLPELKLSPEIQAEVESDIATLESQIKSPRPKSAVIKECLSSVRTVLEGIAGNVIAAILMQQIGPLSK